MTYTAGPWRAVNRSSDGIDDPFLGWDVEGPPQAERGQFARREDAVLVAAAPDMYAVLADFANPDNWEHVDEERWIWRGFPPFERPVRVLLKATTGATR